MSIKYIIALIALVAITGSAVATPISDALGNKAAGNNAKVQAMNTVLAQQGVGSIAYAYYDPNYENLLMIRMNLNKPITKEAALEAAFMLNKAMGKVDILNDDIFTNFNIYVNNNQVASITLVPFATTYDTDANIAKSIVDMAIFW